MAVPTKDRESDGDGRGKWTRSTCSRPRSEFVTHNKKNPSDLSLSPIAEKNPSHSPPQQGREAPSSLSSRAKSLSPPLIAPCHRKRERERFRSSLNRREREEFNYCFNFCFVFIFLFFNFFHNFFLLIFWYKRNRKKKFQKFLIVFLDFFNIKNCKKKIKTMPFLCI